MIEYAIMVLEKHEIVIKPLDYDKFATKMICHHVYS